MSETKKYFNFEELKRFISLEGKTLADVIYFVWINKIDKNAPFVFIDKLQLKFSDGHIITISAGDNSDALHFVDDFDPANEALKLDEEFKGRIILKPHNASKDKFWQDIIDKKITAVNLSKEDTHYLSDVVVLAFGEEKRLIGVSPEEGILIDYYETD